jgi:hypothetical protein
VPQQPAGQIRGRARPGGTKPEAVLQFSHMARRFGRQRHPNIGSIRPSIATGT